VPFRADGFLDVAGKLKNRQLPTGEARDRTIAGRSYYAAYLATCDAICALHRLPLDAYLPHETVSDTLAAYVADPDVKKLGTLLGTLRHLRHHADYIRQKNLLEQQSDDAVDYAQDVFTLLPTVATKLPRIDPVERR